MVLILGDDTQCVCDCQAVCLYCIYNRQSSYPDENTQQNRRPAKGMSKALWLACAIDTLIVILSCSPKPQSVSL